MNLLIHGDSLEMLPELDENSIDAVICDPPYELGFMGKKWDGTGIANSVELWTKVLRVTKPGGFLLAFGGTRTFHRMVCAIEDAGWEIRDSISWVYGSGFPKSTDISKQIDKQAGVKREVVGTYKTPSGRDYTLEKSCQEGYAKTQLSMGKDKGTERRLITSPTDDAAKQWSGWGTALKPAHEDIIVARKPLSEKTVAANILRWGTGALNIDKSRIETIDDVTNHARSTEASISKGIYGDSKSQNTHKTTGQQLGRWPANLILDEEAGKLLENATNRFFYCPKVSKKERELGCQDLPTVHGVGTMQGDADGSLLTGSGNPRDTSAKNHHPTIKPIALMAYLCNLVTQPNGTILDPFAGSGSTGIAAIQEGFNFIGIEKEKDYVTICKHRILTVDNKLEVIAA